MIQDLLNRDWDVIVVGAGMGGGIVGRRLAERGLRILFVECGPDTPRADRSLWEGEIVDPVERRAKGYWPEPVHALIDGRASTFYGPIGTGVGGSSAFYAATLERPEPHDLDHSPEIPHPLGGWPVSYGGFRPYLELAEALLDICGEDDPLSREPSAGLRLAPPLSPGDAEMMASFRRIGLHPYRKHVGVRYLPGCAECFGSKCPRPCKMDGRSAGVEPALSTGRAALLDRCEVTAVRGKPGYVTHLEARRDGIRLKLSARRYVIAAGAFGSPRLLLASASEDWPDGCANESGLVGRNLMAKLYERIAIWPERRGDFRGPVNTISIRDFYQRDGVRYGHLQSMGLEASYGDIVHFLASKFDQVVPRALRPLRGLVRLPAFAAARYLGNARIFQGLLEDLPYPENRVIYDSRRPERLAFEYHLAPELLERRRKFRRMIRAGLGGMRSFFLTRTPDLSLSHACGTLRFGTDPATSVLDPFCRAHSLRNLHVTDSCFMPTSTGINPSLMIAANALRVADRIVSDMASDTPVTRFRHGS